MKTKSRLLFTVLFSAAALLPVFAPSAAQAGQSPGATITEAVKVLQDAVTQGEGKPAAEVDQNLRKILTPVFDFNEMARSSVGSNWSKGTPEEQKEFVDLFSELLARTYLKRIKENVKEADYKLIHETVNGNKALVKTTVIDKGDKIKIDYRMVQKEGPWRVYDVIIEDVGLVTNFRNEFGAIIRKDGFSGLVQRLRDKVAKAKPV